MLPKSITVWAKQFYFTTVGLEAPDELPEHIESIAAESYSKYFYEPVSRMLYGDVRTNIMKDDVNSFLAVMRTMKVPDILHMLLPIVSNGWFVDTGNLEQDLHYSIDKMRENTNEVYCIIKGGKPFKAHADKSGNPFMSLGHKIIQLGETRRFKHGLTLDSLREASPVRANDFVIRAIRNCVKEGILSVEELASDLYCVPAEDGFRTIPVTAATPELPSFATRRLIASLPDSYIKEFQSPYHAAYKYASEHDEYKMCLNELRDIAGWIDDTSSTSELTDEIVIDYLQRKYGISNEELEGLCVPVHKRVYSTTYLIDSENSGMTAEEFIDKIAEDENYATGSLDEIIKAFCNNVGVNLDCTINQLLQSIVYETPAKPKSIFETVKDFMEENSLSENTTLKEFICNVSHVDEEVDETAVTMRVISENPGFSDEVKKCIHDVLYDNKNMEMPDLSESLMRLGVPDEILTAVLVADQTGEAFEVPEIKEDDVVTYLVRQGISRIEAKAACSGKLPESKSLPDVGYQVANSLLYDIRSSICENDTMELRNDLIPLVYSFVRILMLQTQDTEDAIDFLTRKEAECKPYVAKFVTNAINKLKE